MHQLDVIPPIKHPITLAELGRTVDTSITITDAPQSISQPLPTRTPQDTIKTESATPKKSTFAPQPTPPVRTKKEEDMHGDGYAGGDLADTLDRVDLSELNLPGGPISSSRKPEKRIGRGWKKTELWIEQDDQEEIVIDDEDEQLPTSAPVSVKVEDGRMEDVVGETTGSAHPMFVDLNENEELARMAERRRRKLRRKAMKGKSRAEKEEMAREEVDFEAMRFTFLNPDATQVKRPSTLEIRQLTHLLSQREERLFMLQLPLALPPLRPIDEPQITQEIKTEEGGTSSSAGALIPSAPPPSGKIGQLRVHASGKTVLSYGGIDFPIRLANDIRFPQDCMVMEPHVDKKAWRVGRVGSRNEDCTWLIGVPDLKGMASNADA